MFGCVGPFTSTIRSTMDFLNLAAQLAMHVQCKAYVVNGFSLTSFYWLFAPLANKTLTFHHQPWLKHTYLMVSLLEMEGRLELIQTYLINSSLAPPPPPSCTRVAIDKGNRWQEEFFSFWSSTSLNPTSISRAFLLHVNQDQILSYHSLAVNNTLMIVFLKDLNDEA
jgi:hypothetical protein